jgi:hypothetical protein
LLSGSVGDNIPTNQVEDELSEDSDYAMPDKASPSPTKKKQTVPQIDLKPASKPPKVSINQTPASRNNPADRMTKNKLISKTDRKKDQSNLTSPSKKGA